jgi:predicted amidohydrolase
MPVRLAAYPFDVRPSEVESNLKQALSAVQQAAEAGAQLLALPEKWTTSFLPSYDAGLVEASEAALAEVHEAAINVGLIVIGSAPGGAGADGRPYNELHFLGAAGNLRPYRKRMLFSATGEGRQVARGQQLPQAVDTPIGRVLGVICYDLRFPEITREALYQQADLLVCVAQWPWPRVHLFDLMSQARAAENQLFVLSCNRAGEAALDGRNPMRFPGSAVVCGPLGEVQARVDDGELLLTDVDFGTSTEVRSKVPIRRDLERAGLWPSREQG